MRSMARGFPTKQTVPTKITRTLLRLRQGAPGARDGISPLPAPHQHAICPPTAPRVMGACRRRLRPRRGEFPRLTDALFRAIVWSAFNLQFCRYK